ncbi:AraC family transcriptional regulator [Planctobacterium marinum]|uniref:HTH araC/xylS-type domain-containing protein n=1 Tax=Planctobacterium marinum TaxID=1631968 RepID=A0AA48HZ89_9ALTE|nr:hypothetical protein MACH26_40990 [Planctobacterium marinum]
MPAQEHFVFAHILNLYDAMQLMTTLLAFLLATPLLLKRDRQPGDYFLALFLVVQGLSLFKNLMYYNAIIGPHTLAFLHPFEPLPKILLPAFQGLILLWYVRAMMGKPLEIGSMLTWVGLGCAGFFCIISVAAYQLPPAFTYIANACHWAVSLFSVFTGIYAIKLMNEHDESLPHRFSSIERHNLKWLRWIASGFVFVWSMHLGASISGLIGWKEGAHYIGIISNVPPLFLMAIMVVYSQTHAISASNAIQEQKQDSEMEPSVNPKQAEQLNDLMIRVKVYQDPELRLEGLADSMDISPRTLSSLLNKHFKKNFYDFVNDFRVRDAQDQLVNPLNQGKTIQRIFEDAGFNSKTTFNTLFKKHTGYTPSEFRKRASSKIPKTV